MVAQPGCQNDTNKLKIKGVIQKQEIDMEMVHGCLFLLEVRKRKTKNLFLSE